MASSRVLRALSAVTLARKFVIAVVKLLPTGEDFASHVYPCYTSHRKETIMTNNPPSAQIKPASMVSPSS
ncbi:lactaldehyde dehydrogenase [Escherichia coli]|uniref:Lactaldehyde dehydrogenase n=1 Tax=Escherichia coli TaxID=562 RepID=A0A376ML77_ECOLX|nr:lactaldehyde dehydrogenase [Escherichia coli]